MIKYVMIWTLRDLLIYTNIQLCIMAKLCPALSYNSNVYLMVTPFSNARSLLIDFYSRLLFLTLNLMDKKGVKL